MRRPQTSARHAATGEIIHLPDGQAATFRSRIAAGERFLCPACDQPFKTARGGSKRDHFVHAGPAASAYHAMTAAHFDAQALLHRWALDQGLTARLEQRVHDGIRRADVLVTFPGSEQVALEVQYSGLTIEHWQARHRDYRDRGIVDVWLWHLDPERLREHRRLEGDPVRLTAKTQAVQEAAIWEGLPALWWLPEGRIATGYQGRSRQDELESLEQTRDPEVLESELADWFGIRSRDDQDRLNFAGLRQPCWGDEVEVDIAPLANCRLTPAGIATPMLDRIRAERARLQRAVDRLPQDTTQPDRQILEQHDQQSPPTPPVQTAADTALLAERNKHKDLEGAKASVGAAYAGLRTRLPESAFTMLTAPDATDAMVQPPATELRCWLYEVIRDRLLVRDWTLFVRWLMRQCHLLGVTELQPYGVASVVDAMLGRLVAHGIIEIEAGASLSSFQQRRERVIVKGARFDNWEPGSHPESIA